jgi:hypothetical protein
MLVKIGMAALAVLLALNLLATLGTRAAGKPTAETKTSTAWSGFNTTTNQEMLFREAGEKRWELAGSIQVSGSTGYLIFRK